MLDMAKVNRLTERVNRYTMFQCASLNFAIFLQNRLKVLHIQRSPTEPVGPVEITKPQSTQRLINKGCIDVPMSVSLSVGEVTAYLPVLQPCLMDMVGKKENH